MKNHLIETGSTRTGSMLIWDTGVYEILPYRKMAPKKRNQVDYDETDHPSCSDTEEDSEEENDKPGRYFQLERKYVSESEKLREAFQKVSPFLSLIAFPHTSLTLECLFFPFRGEFAFGGKAFVGNLG